jgi:hypothetical protein
MLKTLLLIVAGDRMAGGKGIENSLPCHSALPCHDGKDRENKREEKVK